MTSLIDLLQLARLTLSKNKEPVTGPVGLRVPTKLIRTQVYLITGATLLIFKSLMTLISPKS